jgi:hypothetical protein
MLASNVYGKSSFRIFCGLTRRCQRPQPKPVVNFFAAQCVPRGETCLLARAPMATHRTRGPKRWILWFSALQRPPMDTRSSRNGTMLTSANGSQDWRLWLIPRGIKFRSQILSSRRHVLRVSRPTERMHARIPMRTLVSPEINLFQARHNSWFGFACFCMALHTAR